MAHSKRDIINTKRAKAAEGVGADPGIEVGGTRHGSLVGEIVHEPTQLIGLLHEVGDVADDGDIVIHNAEQTAIIGELQRLKSDTNSVLALAAEMRHEDESLYRQDVEWWQATCAHAERWIDDAGNLGWRVGIQFADPSARKFLAYVEGKLSALGWEDTIAEAWGG